MLLPSSKPPEVRQDEDDPTKVHVRFFVLPIDPTDEELEILEKSNPGITAKYEILRSSIP